MNKTEFLCKKKRVSKSYQQLLFFLRNCRTTLTDLQPYTYYTFRVSACTSGTFAGCVTSAGVIVDTKLDVPEGQGPPEVIPLSPTELLVKWEPPEHANGRIYFTYQMN